MIRENDHGGFGELDEASAREWCVANVASHDSVTGLAEACASTFDFYREDGTLPERLVEIAGSVLSEDIGGFGKYLTGVLEEEHRNRIRARRPLEVESWGKARQLRTQELPQNRVRIGR